MIVEKRGEYEEVREKMKGLREMTGVSNAIQSALESRNL